MLKSKYPLAIYLFLVYLKTNRITDFDINVGIMPKIKVGERSIKKDMLG